eukprot:scaffold81152_cov80-Phaeocystis_antarctica.AAC.4
MGRIRAAMSAVARRNVEALSKGLHITLQDHTKRQARERKLLRSKTDRAGGEGDRQTDRYGRKEALVCPEHS